jgi:hypothetical protein
VCVCGGGSFKPQKCTPVADVFDVEIGRVLLGVDDGLSDGVKHEQDAGLDGAGVDFIFSFDRILCMEVGKGQLQILE